MVVGVGWPCHDEPVRRLGARAIVVGLVVGACSGGSGADPAAPAGPEPTRPPVVTGVPGIAASNSFCAAWSRFAGSFQVVAVASAFLTEQPDRAWELEVAAADTVAAAHTALAGEWPGELADERSAVLDDTLGAYAARADAAVGHLRAAGATDTQLAALAEAWLQALATRNPEQPDVALVLDDQLAALVRTAANQMAAGAAPLVADPALVSDAATPLTDAYLASTCPDEGLLAGGEVSG